MLEAHAINASLTIFVKTEAQTFHKQLLKNNF